MNSINKLRKIYHLKHVERMNSVLKRKESSAEHSWSCLILADYFLSQMNEDIDRLKVYELLMYHDVIEIEAGDIPIHHVEERKNKKEKEQKAFVKIKENFPEELKEKFSKLFEEFEEQKTKEAKFARAVDRLDALIHEMDYKVDWKEWTEEMVRRFYQEEIKDFPIIKEAFEKILKYVVKEGYYDQAA